MIAFVRGVIAADGEAGAVVTNNLKYVEPIKQLRDQGQSEKYHHKYVGYNYRMEAIQGAVLNVKLSHLDAWNDARRKHAVTYRELLDGLGVRLLSELPGHTSVHHVFPVFTDKREDLDQYLRAAGVGTGIHYPVPVHLQPGYSHLGYRVGDLPETERAAGETLSLPMYAELPVADITRVANSIRMFCEQAVAVHQ